MIISPTVTRWANRNLTARRFEGFYESGRHQRREVSCWDFKANVQPARGADIERLPENYRQQAAVAIYTLEDLRTGSAGTGPTDPGVMSDHVIIEGLEYEIMTVERWPQHTRYIATRAQQ